MKNPTDQFTTFYVGGELFGIDVMSVQEVAGKPSIVPVPLAPSFVRGLINLRGQIATAMGLRELFDQPKIEDEMSVVCRLDGNLVSLIVDSIGDVLELKREDFEETPDTLPAGIRKFVKGIYKVDNTFLSVINLEVLSKELSPSIEVTN